MTRTTTRQINFETLKLRGASAVVVIKLMMAANDMSYANQNLADYKAAVERGDRNVRPNGGLYWVRLQIAHMSEAFVIINQIRDTPDLMNFVDQCDRRTRESFANLLPFLHGGAKHDQFRQLVEKVRNNVAFHYQCDKLIGKTIGTLASRSGHRISTITRGDDVRLWHFQAADVVLDTIVVRELWQVPLTRAAIDGADEAAWNTHLMFLDFMDFAGEFIWKYCET
ncbi:hypothetical protein ACGLHS_16900 [Variovorax sp. VaC1]|uniref:hypothetical protein n=1 Tax=Variovorax sp. VaC1 TaxID=3373132 RepID=UPI00374A1904